MISYLPNIISALRVAISPVFFALLVSEREENKLLAAALFVVGAVTDYFDGWVARRYGVVSRWGTFIDPLADKFLTTAAFIGFAFLSVIPWWMVSIVILRDFGTTFLRLYAEKYDIKMKTSRGAKTKTFLQMSFISYVLTLMAISGSGVSALDSDTLHELVYSAFTYYAMAALTALSVWTLLEYLFAVIPAKLKAR